MPHLYYDLLALADEAEIIAEQQQPTIISNSLQVIHENGNSIHENGNSIQEGTSGPGAGTGAVEADDDPHRLARVNLEHYNTRTDGRTLAYWRGEWYSWKRNAYRKIDKEELRAKLSVAIKAEFDRLNVEQQAMAAERGRDDAGPIVSQKVTMALVSNVMQATSGMTCVSAEIEPNTWMPDKSRRHCVSMANGLVDIDTVLADRDDYLQPNTPQWFSMVSLPYAFDPAAACPRWDAFLEYNLEMDPERIKLAQEWAGYLLTSSTDEQKFMILEGESKNGKSVFIAGLTAMLGVDNTSNVALENFGDRFQLTNTVGKFLNAAGDCGELDKTAEGLIKSFVSGDRMFFDRKGLSGFNAVPTARLMVACNNRPRFSDRSGGIWRRMLVIPWQIEIDKQKRVKGMDKVAWWERSGELSGIFRWALVGLARLRRQGDFTESSVMNASLEEYKEEMNPARAFLQQHVEENNSGLIRSSELFRIYKKWCDENGYRPLSEKVFGKEVKRVFHQSSRVKRGDRSERYWCYERIQFSQESICGEDTAELRLF
jgi:P4 family phage/plasmid primase-like protien